ncbi:neural cell adhesion molecule 2-like [Periophthalmus magnuspinnatus]|uniref:neural cell adhesion molecule 2-like n=1 Tax=Periophthalmus magnuspinnatus TaxID=409849 RepID=UPI002436BBD6|nr:neural cell adhesion molecule 2-like [Periophthalmus magnuspinnatus]
MVGDNVTLRCIKNKKIKPSTKFDFYKDGIRVDTSSTGELTLYNISLSDQGLYKCNIFENEFSTENWLQVKAVLLECPDQPVMEGENVTLFCRDKMAAANYTSFFYKDDQMIWNSSSGKLILNKVSKTDEGVYKCQTSEDRESEEQWLAVRGGNSSITPAHGVLSLSPLTALVALPVLLFILGFIYKKYKVWLKTDLFRLSYLW